MKRTLLLIMLFYAFAVNAEYVVSIEKLNNTMTKDWFVNAQLNFKEGDVIGKDHLSKSRVNLLMTELFGVVEFSAMKADSGLRDWIDIDSVDAENEDDSIFVFYIAKEILPVLPVIGFISDPNKGTAVLFGLSYNNLWNIRHKIEGSIQLGFSREYTLFYQVPPVYSRNYNLYAKGAITSRKRETLNMTEFHKFAAMGGGLSWDPKIVPEILLGYDRVSFDPDTFSFAYRNASGKGYDEFALADIKLTADYRDNPFFPENGFYGIAKLRYENNWWSDRLERYKVLSDLRFFKSVPGGVLAVRNKTDVQFGTLAYYDQIVPEPLENRCIADSFALGMNKNTITVEYRWRLPLKLTYDIPIIGAFSIYTMVALFSDMSYVTQDAASFRPYDFSAYRYGVGAGFRIYSELFSSTGIDIGWDPVIGGTEGLKLNLVIVSWNF